MYLKEEFSLKILTSKEVYYFRRNDDGRAGVVKRCFRDTFGPTY